MKQEVCVLAIYVHSIEEAKKYYCDILGFEIEQEYDECIIRLKNEGVTLLLELIGEGYPPQPCVVPALETDNILTEIQLLKSKGVEFIFNEPQEFPAGTYTAFKDPSGNIIELLEFRK